MNKPIYQPEIIEKKWQEKWEKEQIYKVDLDHAKNPFYNLMMFPYPSAEGLHMGSFFTYGGIDIYGRYKRMNGFTVFEPIGLDGFGIHSENYALKVGRSPQEHAQISEKNFYRQLRMLGNGFDWSRKVETYDPMYYKWTQWLFIQLFTKGLAYRKKASVNFCPSCKTVLADEQIIDSKCERCNSIVEKKDLEQWFFKITHYQDKLLNNIAKLDWSSKVKTAQKNWIGKKEGLEIVYKIDESAESIAIFTTHPETNYGATFIAIAPEHRLIPVLTKSQYKKEVESYSKASKIKTEQERIAEGVEEKTGVFTGSYAINPLTGFKMPIWVSDFVLSDFGTGALVGVPAHDKRDFLFAKKFNLAVIKVIEKTPGDISELEEVQDKEGIMIGSDTLNGLSIEQARTKIIEDIIKQGYGTKVVKYHLRDWLISRQRYWGPPIPMILCSVCGWQPVPINQLPVLLPDLDNWQPTSDGKSPLSRLATWKKTPCPVCGKEAERETDVSDTFLDSAWYFFRYTSTDIDDKAFDIERVRKWLPVASYIGGAEHSVLHLLYARFITMVLADLNLIDFDEPFSRFRANGLIIKDGAKMSKSKGNVIIPDAYVKKYGADTLRCYLAFIGPFSQGGDFSDNGIEGMYKFLRRIHSLCIHTLSSTSRESITDNDLYSMNKTIKKVTEDIENLRYNTAIAEIMTWNNYLMKKTSISKKEIEVLLKLLAPFAPHVTEEIWQSYFSTDKDNFSSIHNQKWPIYEEKYLYRKKIPFVVQINGKKKHVIEVDADLNEEQVKSIVFEDSKIKSYITDSKIKKMFFVKHKLFNIVLV